MPLSELTLEEVKAIGRKIRDLRQQRDLTLPELARQTGLSASFLSRVERGLCVPSLDALMNLARTLGKTTTELFPVKAPVVTQSPAGGITTVDRSARLFGEFLSGNPSVKLGMCNMAARLSFPGQHTHPGQEIICVLDGRAEIELGQEKHLLNKGECFEFSAETPHNIWNPSDSLSRLMIATVSEKHYLQKRK